MNFDTEILTSSKTINIQNLLPAIGKEDMIVDIVNGLTAEKRSLSAKYFYDEAGSALFEEITHLDEYYPTRTEKSILEKIAPELMQKYASFDVIELGSGDASKISLLLNSLSIELISDKNYYPVDVSQSAILQSAESLASRFEGLNINGYVLDFTRQLDQIRRERPALICFFGSTIGNFDEKSSRTLIKNISKSMNKGDVFLLGMDLVKPKPILNAAYNDDKGVTAAFNKNVLNTVNSIIDADFNMDDFDHLAFFNEELSRIEMHLKANKNVKVNSPFFKESLFIKKGESIHTENSHKYSFKDIFNIGQYSGLIPVKINTDPKQWFSLTLFEKA